MLNDVDGVADQTRVAWITPSQTLQSPRPPIIPPYTSIQSGLPRAPAALAQRRAALLPPDARAGQGRRGFAAVRRVYEVFIGCVCDDYGQTGDWSICPSADRLTGRMGKEKPGGESSHKLPRINDWCMHTHNTIFPCRRLADLERRFLAQARQRVEVCLSLYMCAVVVGENRGAGAGGGTKHEILLCVCRIPVFV